MNTSRRQFLGVAGAVGTAIIADKRVSGYGRTRWPGGVQQDQLKRPLMTELFLDNTLLEVTPGVSRRLHQAKKHLLNPVVRCDRWWEGNSMQPYTTMYDEEDKLFKMWARVGSDWSSAYVDGNAAYMAYLTSTNGVDWDKPSLGVTTLAGRRDHNDAGSGIVGSWRRGQRRIGLCGLNCPAGL